MKEQIKILAVDDEPGMLDLLSYDLCSHNYKVVTAVNGEDALEKAGKEKFNLVISDIKMPRMGGLELLAAIKKIDPDIEVIISTGYGTIEMAVSAIKMGAYDFVQKPFDLDKVLVVIERALEKSELRMRVKTLSSLLPICSCCKRIRNDKGYWNRVETYLEEHSDVRLSHGICPDCMTELYPKLSRKKG